MDPLFQTTVRQNSKWTASNQHLSAPMHIFHLPTYEPKWYAHMCFSVSSLTVVNIDVPMNYKK